MEYQLISFKNSQIGKMIMRGNVELTGNNANGFIEKILELGLEEYHFTVTTQEKGDIKYAFSIPGEVF